MDVWRPERRVFECQAFDRACINRWRTKQEIGLVTFEQLKPLRNKAAFTANLCIIAILSSADAT